MKHLLATAMCSAVAFAAPAAAQATVAPTPFEAAVNAGNHSPAWDSYSTLGAWLTKADVDNANVSVAVAGRSVQGRNLYVARVNMPAVPADSVLLDVPMVMAGQHAGTEQISVEAGAAIMREWANTHTTPLLVMWPNPDGYVNRTRSNAHKIDLNRDQVRAFTSTGQPESEAMQATIGMYGVDEVADLHETGRHAPRYPGSRQVEFLDLAHWPYGSATVKARSIALNVAAQAAARAAGYTTSTYVFDPVQKPGSLGEALTRYRGAPFVGIETQGNGLQARDTRLREQLAALHGALGGDATD
jgi:hypothetical protein